jgi:hypothetical protein
MRILILGEMEFKTLIDTGDEVCRLNVEFLKPHPENAKIYGNLDVGDLLESIRDNGLMEPIVVKQGTIISGHRRAQACKELGIELVPCILVEKEINDVEALVEFNIQREKVWSTRVMEALTLEKIEVEKAMLRKKAGKRDLTQKSAEGSRRPETAAVVAKKIFNASKEYFKSCKEVKALVELELLPGEDWRSHELVRALDQQERKVNSVLRALRSKVAKSPPKKPPVYSESDYEWVDEKILWYIDDEDFTPARKVAALKWLKEKTSEIEKSLKAEAKNSQPSSRK